MNSNAEQDVLAERPGLDFSKGVRGKYSKAIQDGSNIVLIDLDLVDMFPNEAAVNEALRGLKQLAERASHAHFQGA